jgi:LPXTG-site transpeptidase (sortase) family protein
MKFKALLIRISLTATLALCLFSIVFILYFIYQNGEKSDSIPLTASANFFLKKEKEKSSLPARLVIPSLKINASIEYVGLTPNGAMDVPTGPANVAWFDLGPRPGDNGSSVIDGHSGYKNNKPAVFDNLYKLHKGDKIYVEDSQGATITFITREIRSYDPKADASDVFISNDGKSHLNLITCVGFWDKILKSHSERLIVFTDKEIK